MSYELLISAGNTHPPAPFSVPKKGRTKPLFGTERGWGECYLILSILLSILIITPLQSDEKTKIEIESSLSLYRQTERYLKQNTPDSILNAIISTQQRVINPFAVKRTRLELAKYYLNKNAVQNTISIIDRYLLDPSDTIIYPKAKILQIEVYLKTKQSSEALKAYKELITLYPQYDTSRELLDQVSDLYDAPLKPKDILPTVKEKIGYIRTLYEAKAYPAAIEQIHLFKDFFIGTPYWEDALYYEGVCYYHLSNYHNAYSLIEEAIGIRKIDRQQWPEAEYWFSKSLKAANQSDWAQQRMMRVVRDAKPTDWMIGEAYYQVLTYFKDSKNNEEDIPKYEADFEKFAKKSPYFERYQWEKSPKPSPEVSEKLFQIYSQVIKNSDTIQDKSINPMTWGNTHMPVSYGVEKTYSNYLESKKRPQWNSWKRFIDEMKGYDMDDIGYDQLRHRIFNSKTIPIDEIETVLYLQNTRREYPQSIQSISEYIPPDLIANGNIPGKLVQYYYPRPYWAWITDASKKYNVDPYLLLTLIRQRSHFNVTLKLNGNYGLCQIDGDLAQEFSKTMGIKWVGTEDLFMPQRNIMYGAFYLSQLKKAYNNNYALMIAALSTEITTVNTWLGFPPKIPDTLQETIPVIVYTQTRDIIRETLENYLIYRMMYD